MICKTSILTDCSELQLLQYFLFRFVSMPEPQVVAELCSQIQSLKMLDHSQTVALQLRLHTEALTPVSLHLGCACVDDVIDDLQGQKEKSYPTALPL